MIFDVVIERCESLDETDREAISAENIWLRDVAKKIEETNCELIEQEIADFSTIFVRLVLEII